MATFNKDKLTGPVQSIAGQRSWYYTDTGLRDGDVAEVEGFFTTGYACGMRLKDFVFITEGDTGSGAALNNFGRVYCHPVVKAQDTGTTQVTVGLGTLVGDTS
jgi:hypothetical protein